MTTADFFSFVVLAKYCHFSRVCVTCVRCPFCSLVKSRNNSCVYEWSSSCSQFFFSYLEWSPVKWKPQAQLGFLSKHEHATRPYFTALSFFIFLPPKPWYLDEELRRKRRVWETLQTRRSHRLSRKKLSGFREKVRRVCMCVLCSVGKWILGEMRSQPTRKSFFFNQTLCHFLLAQFPNHPRDFNRAEEIETLVVCLRESEITITVSIVENRKKKWRKKKWNARSFLEIRHVIMLLMLNQRRMSVDFEFFGWNPAALLIKRHS